MLPAHSHKTGTTVRRVLSLVAAALAVLSLGVAGRDQAEAATGPAFTNLGTPNSADPTLVFHNGFYYYVATTWSSDVLMRRSTPIAGLRNAPEQSVFRATQNEGC